MRQGPEGKSATTRGPALGARAVGALAGALGLYALSASTYGTPSAAVDDARALPAIPLDACNLDRDELTDFSGVVHVTNAQGLICELARGEAGAGKSLERDSIFWIGSISKQFVAAALLTLVEQGKASLSAPVRSYVPSWPANALEYNGTPCSLEHLLSHTCGLRGRLLAREEYHDALTRDDRREAFLQAVGTEPLLTLPGTQFLYSNLGYDLAGVLVGLISGQDYEAFVREHLWLPAGMHSTGIRPSSVSEFHTRIAHGHFLLGWHWLSAPTWLRLDPELPSHFGASGSVYSTVADLERWARALVAGRVLLPETVKQMMRPRRNRYGLGLVISEQPYGKLIWHNGALVPHGYNSYLAIALETKTVAVVLSNHTPHLSRAQDLGASRLAVFHGEPSGRGRSDAGGMQRLQASFVPLWFLVFSIGSVGALLIAPLRRARSGLVRKLLSYAGTACLAIMVLGIWHGTDAASRIAAVVALATCSGLAWILRAERDTPLWSKAKRWHEALWLASVALLLALPLTLMVQPVRLIAVGLLLLAVGALLWVGKRRRALQKRDARPL